MGRPKLKLVVSAAPQAQLRQAFKQHTDRWQRDRLQVAQLATTGRHTHAEIAGLVGRARSTVQAWVDRYAAAGLEGLLARQKAPGKPSELQSPKIRAQLQAGLRAGRWRTAGQLAAWLDVLLAGKSRRGVEGATPRACQTGPGGRR